jgi:hypothetical protein
LLLTWASFISIHFKIIPINPSFFWSLSFRIRDQNLLFIYLHSNTCDMPSPSYHPLFSYTSDIWWWLKVMKLPIMQFSPVSFHFPLIGTDIYAAPYTQTPCAIVRSWGWHTKFRASSKYRPSCTAIYCNIYILGNENRRQVVLN